MLSSRRLPKVQASRRSPRRLGQHARMRTLSWSTTIKPSTCSQSAPEGVFGVKQAPAQTTPIGRRPTFAVQKLRRRRPIVFLRVCRKRHTTQSFKKGAGCVTCFPFPESYSSQPQKKWLNQEQRATFQRPFFFFRIGIRKPGPL